MGQRTLEVLLALVVGVVLVLGVLAWQGRDGNGDEADTPSDRATTDETTTEQTVVDTIPPGAPADTDEFLELWARHRQADHALDGLLELYDVPTDSGVDLAAPLGEPAASIEVRRARSADRSLDQVGSSSLVTADGEQRSCERDPAGEDGEEAPVVLCAQPIPAPSLEDELAAIGQRFAGPDPGYELFRQDDCWRAVATVPSPLLAWGQITVWCFDEATGVVASETTWNGRRIEQFRAEEIRTDVTEDDLTPR